MEKNEGGRFNYQINNSERKISNYGEVVEIPVDQTSQFVTKGLRITIKPDPDKAASFLVEKEVDLRSIGGKLYLEKFSMSFASGVAVFGDKMIADGH